MFTHLHTHSEYSLLDGMSTIPAIVERVCELGQSGIAVTDHGVLYGALKFYEQARANGINPIIGMEAYVAPGDRTDRNPDDRTPYHLTLLAQNETGYRNLLRLSSASHLEGFYYRPRVDRSLLEQHGEGLIVLSACPSGEVLSALQDGRTDQASEALGWYKDVFPGRYYVELQEHHDEQFSQYTPQLVALARKFDLPLVLTNDSHYTSEDQQHAHDVLLCVGTRKTVDAENRMKFANGSFYLKSEEEMRALLPELPEACDETARIAEQVDIRLEFGRTLLPDPGIPAGTTPAEYLHDLSYQGLRERYPNATTEQVERLDYELSVIAETGFNEYMLIVRDIAQFAQGRGIPMGVRGSAAASIVLHCLGVTDIEPTQYRLVFERFLNLERREMPDVDFDFADNRREEVIQYTAERYGREHVAQIVTFGRFGPKAAIRDGGRALGVSYDTVDRVARMIPGGPGVTFDQVLGNSDLRDASDADPQVAELLATAQQFEGVARHASTHAAGVVISREPLVEIVPLQRATSNRGEGEEAGLSTTQYDMNDVAKIGLLKLDYLGLTNLTILDCALSLVGNGLRAEDIPDEDPDTDALLTSGHTFGVFQLEGDGMKGCVQDLQPKGVRELAAVVALYRPGPMEHIPRYVNVKFGKEQARYPHPDLAPILDETYGVITYQDQVLEITKSFAGYTLGEADVMRKAMGKKIASVMHDERSKFVDGAVAAGYERLIAEQVFAMIEPFAGYAFNKAHAFSYATLAYRSAWMKAHHPVEFMTAVLQSAGQRTGGQAAIAAAMSECVRMGIELLPPDINASGAYFEGDGGNAIRFGLAQIKTVGLGAATSLIETRAADGEFCSIEDFASRFEPDRCNRRMVEALAKVGAFDSLLVGHEGLDRATVAAGADRVMACAQQAAQQRAGGQMGMFGGADLPEMSRPRLELEPVTATAEEVTAWEHDLLGAYVSGHPFRHVAEQVRDWVTHQVADIEAGVTNGRAVLIAGTITAIRSLSTRKSGEAFCALTIEDLSGSTEVTVWPDQYRRIGTLLQSGVPVLVEVKVRDRDDRVRVAVERLVKWDSESKLPLNDGEAWRKRADAARRVRHPQREAAAPVSGSVPNVSPKAAHAGSSPEAPVGASLSVTIVESGDRNEDSQRLETLMALVHAHRGNERLDLIIVAGSGEQVRLRLPDVDDAAAIARRASPD